MAGVLIVRSDADTQIGTGHFMRCLALAQAWQDAGSEVNFITACHSNGLLQRLQDEGFHTRILARQHPDPGDWNDTKSLLAAYPDAWLVLDGYHFDEAYQQRVKDAGGRLLVIDDLAHLKHYYADIVLNQNLHAEHLHYSGEPHTRLLLGTRYALLRREFLAWSDWRREIPEVARRVLVTLGGGDPANHTLKVVQALQRVDLTGLEATVAVGASNPHADSLEAAIKLSQFPIRLMRDVPDMPELITQADLAISSAGTTVWELLFLGTPTLTLVVADNQRLIAQAVDRAGAVVNLGRAEDLPAEALTRAIVSLAQDHKTRLKMSERGRRLVDGRGVERVLAAMRVNRGQELQ